MASAVCRLLCAFVFFPKRLGPVDNPLKASRSRDVYVTVNLLLAPAVCGAYEAPRRYGMEGGTNVIYSNATEIEVNAEK